jgi:PAS domain S-box-containing protein
MTKPEGQPSENPLHKHRDLQSFYEYSPAAALVTDVNGVIKDMGLAMLEFFNLPAEKVIGRNIGDWLQPLNGIAEQTAGLLKQEIKNREFSLKRPDGSTLCVLVNSKTQNDQGGRVYLSFTDISALKKKENLYAYLNQAAAELAKARDTRNALEQISRFIVPKFADWFSIDVLREGNLDSLYLKHEDPKKIAWARQYRENYPPDMNSNSGASAVIKSGKPGFVAVVTGQMIAAVVPDPVQLKALQQIGMQSVIIAPMSSRAGITGVVNFISSEPGRHFDETDLEFAINFASLIGLSLDNARLNEEAAIEIGKRKESEGRFRFLADAIPHKMWTASPDGRATYYNQGWYEYTGFTDFETLRNNVWEVIHPDDRAVAAELWPKAMKTGEGTEMEHRFRQHDGLYRWHLSRFVPHKNDTGEILIWIGTSTDIHEQKESRLAIETANNQLSSNNNELAAVNEELSSSNEELAAVNEELAITNEELLETQNELHRALQELAKNTEGQARLAAIIATSDDTILSKTLQGIITSWNNAAERMFGYTSAEAVGKHISLIIPPSRLKEEEYIIGQITQGKPVEHFETVRVTKDGREISISLSVSPIVDVTGKIIGASKIARDISSRKADEESIRRYTERLETMNAIIEAIAEELDLNKILQKVTDATTLLTGAKFGAFFYNVINETGEAYKLYTLSGAPREAFEKFGTPRNTILFHPTFTGEGVVRSDDITRDPRYGQNSPHFGMPKGHLPVVSYLAVPVVSRSGNVIGALFFGHPDPGIFTKDHETLVAAIAAQAAIGIDNARLYEEVKVLNEKKDEFIGLASHELKTPLTSIGGYLQILNKTSRDEQSRKFVTRTLHQVQKLTALVNDLLDVSKIEAGKLQLLKEEFDLRQIVDESIELIQHTNDRYQITLETTVNSCMVSGDSQRIEQVLINLLTNAIKYSPGTDRVIVSLTCDQNNATVGVQDFGMGIPDSQKVQVFSRFYRVEETNPNISGLGIGLYISQEIISRHSGKIWVEGDVGKGSAFYFSLPLEK